VIADSATLSGTMRTFNPKLRTLLKQRINDMVNQISSAHGANAEVEFSDGYPALFNDFEHTELIRSLFVKGLESNTIIETGPRMGVEDFAYYLQEIPGSFYYVRAGASQTKNYPHHHPKFQLDERCLINGTKSILTIVAHYNRVKVGETHAHKL